MAFNGSGTFNRTNGTNTGSTTWALDAGAGTKILSTRHDTHDQDIADGLSNTICRDGQSTITADIPFNNKKITGLAAATASDNAPRFDQIVDGRFGTGTSGGSANAYTLTLDVAPDAYTDGQMFWFEPGADNTATSTLNVNGLGTKTIKTMDGQALFAGALRSGYKSVVIYDGTDFFLVNPHYLWKAGLESYTPSYGASGSMTFTSVTTTFARYQYLGGDLMYITFRADGTLGGTTSSQVSVSLPSGFGASDDSSVLSVRIRDGAGTDHPGSAFVTSVGNDIQVAKADFSNIALGSSAIIWASGIYRID